MSPWATRPHSCRPEDQLKTIEHLAGTHPLKDDFVLVSTKASAAQWANTALLFNKAALASLIGRYHAEFEAQLKPALTAHYGEQDAFAARDIAAYLVQNPLPNEVIENDVVLAMLLGYGAANGKRHAAGETYAMAPPSTVYRQAQQYLSDHKLPRLPGFVSRDSDDNTDAIARLVLGCEQLAERGYPRQLPASHAETDQVIKSGLSEFFQDDLFQLHPAATGAEEGGRAPAAPVDAPRRAHRNARNRGPGAARRSVPGQRAREPLGALSMPAPASPVPSAPERPRNRPPVG
jgi:hypothetical protein